MPPVERSGLGGPISSGAACGPGGPGRSLSCMPENVSLVVAGRTAISDSRSSATENWRHRLLSLTLFRGGWFETRIWPRVLSGARAVAAHRACERYDHGH